MSGEEPASKVCYAEEAEAAYMGFASREEIAAFLGALLEGGRDKAEKLRAMLPKIRDESLHAELKALLAALDEINARLEAARAEQGR